MVRIEELTDSDLLKYKEIFIKAEILGMTAQEAVKVVSDNLEKILFVCGPIWMIFSYDMNNKLIYQTFMVNDEGKVISFTKDDYQVNVYDNMIYLLYEDGRHESLQFIKNKDTPNFDVSSNGIVVHMEYDSKRDIRCVKKYEHYAYGNIDWIYDIRLSSPFEVTLESKVSKRDKGLKFFGFKDSFYRMDFNISDNRWQYDLATIQEFGVDAVVAHDTISLHNGVREFSKYYKVLFSLGDYITITGFPFTSQYDKDTIFRFIKQYGFSQLVPVNIVGLYNDKGKYLDSLQKLVYLYNGKVSDDNFSILKKNIV
ncbi:MAG: hypothetical protein ACI4XM_06620 [Candidatus Coprovivens sp.]